MNILRGGLALASLALVLVPGAGAGDASRVSIQAIGAQFRTTAADGCTTKQADVQAAAVDHRPPETPSTERALYFSLITYDACNGQWYSAVSGSSQLPPGALSIDGGMQSATLNLETVGIDSVTGSPVSVSIRLTWTATQHESDQTTSSHFHSPLQVVNYVRTFDSWSGTATGSIKADTAEYAEGLQWGYLYHEEGPYIDIPKAPRTAAIAAAGTATTTLTGNATVQSGEDIQAEWFQRDASGCAYSQTDIYAYNRRPGSLWGVDTDTLSVISIGSFAYNACTGTTTRELYAYKLLAPGDLRVSTGGSKLTLNLEAYDYLTASNVPMQVDLRWNGDGAPSGWQLTQRLEQGGTTYQRHVNQFWRNASVSGTLTAGGLSLLDGPLAWATLSTFDDRTIAQ